MKKEKITPDTFRKMKEKEEKITMLTAYDYPTAKLIEKSNVDSVLVGDSVGNTVLGHKNTLQVNVEEMIHHAKAVSKGVENTLMAVDMPFMSYQSSKEEAIKNAGKIIKESGGEAVKIEGGSESLNQIEGIIDSGVPVIGHLGLTPQKILQFGGYQPRGMKAERAKTIFDEAKMLEEAGVFCIVLESIPSQLAQMITERLDIPTIGIGAGVHCDGQVLVLHDMLGLSDLSTKFVKEYTNLSSIIDDALEKYSQEVTEEKFPSPKHTYNMGEKELEKLKKYIK